MQIEIWSDVVCPWCAIGRARFNKALAAFEHRDEVQVRWRSFELDPQAPREPDGVDLVDHLATKYGIPREQALAMNQRVTESAAAEGLEFRLDRAQRGATFDAHRVLHLAADRGVQDAVKDRFFRAYFTEGARISDPDVLAELAAEAGLDAAEVREVLAGDRYAAQVRADQAQARAYGITGVPFFVLDRRYGISGAQPVELLASALQQAWAEHRPVLQPTPAAGDACADGSCAV
ncbi:Predicted dithiol-disulfide isomerase, DsbA family [Pseudonocardia thermophila]|uniref:Predicted dithiol-disulfide isomerase, DsbA family n=1 Tax=Pseudonocardia thermophila TaxID=1848 RepID=A0A1M6ZLA3_PSETH|nr:DsbA family oxidoreductase [Pseudonocardia thermophila]SHL31115.1 Predicted dithiol-disulfide isomerase, DsbA family [Pseudonocardia thermophila]